MREQTKTSNSATMPGVTNGKGQVASVLAARASQSDRLNLIETIYDFVNENLIEHVVTLLSNADATLNTRLESCDNNEDEMRYLALQRFVAADRDNLNRHFFIALNDHLKPGTTTAEFDEDEMALVSEDEMEEMVATTTMHAHAIGQYGNEINHLEVRLEYLEITSEGIIEKESLSPKKLGTAFLVALKAFDLASKDRLELFKMFDAEVTPKLGGMYKAINDMLIQAGVMPKIVLKNAKEENTVNDSNAVETRAANYYDPQANPANNFIPRTPQDMAYLASQFMQGDFIPSENAIGLPESFTKPISTCEADGKNYYARKDVMRALSQLQNQIVKKDKQNQQISIDEIKQSLFSEMGKQEGGIITKQVNVLDERSIDFVGMMFNAITHDPSLSSIIKNLLLSLQIPVIKVAMSDTELFQKETHPTRDVLDLISEAGKGVTEESDYIYENLENIVDGVLEDYDVDIDSFNTAADALRELINEEQSITQENEKHEQKEVMVAHARDVVVNEIKHIAGHKNIPKNVAPLITKSWPSLMVNRYIRYGTDSWPWLESVMLMKLMIKSLQPIRSNGQWRTVWSNHLTLVDTIRDELETTRQDKQAISEQVEILKSTFIDLLDAYGYKLTEEDDLAPDSEEEQATTVVPGAGVFAINDPAEEESEKRHAVELEEIARLAQEKLGQLPSNVHPGVWFEIFNGDDKIVRRLKLSVILTGVAKLVFVDRKGVMVIEKDAADFANELSKEQSRFIADHSTFEHALGQVIHSIAA